MIDQPTRAGLKGASCWTKAGDASTAVVGEERRSREQSSLVITKIVDFRTTASPRVQQLGAFWLFSSLFSFPRRVEVPGDHKRFVGVVLLLA